VCEANDVFRNTAGAVIAALTGAVVRRSVEMLTGSHGDEAVSDLT
jgi:hypothetical protein